MATTTLPNPPANPPAWAPNQGVDTGPTSNSTSVPETSIGNVFAGTNDGNGAYGPITNAQQAAAFIDPNTGALTNMINNLPTNSAAAIAGNQAPLASPISGITSLNTAASNAITAAQLQQANNLNNTAQGLGPSVAATQAQQTGQQNVANEMAMIASQRGGSANSALGLRSAQNAIAQANQQAVQAATLGKTQEELNAQQQLTGALGTTQGQVMQGAQAQGAMNQQVALANQATQSATQQANLSAAQQIALANQSAAQQTQALNVNEANDQYQAAQALTNNDMTASENYANLVTGENTQLQGLFAGQSINNANNQMGLTGAEISGGAAALGGLVAMSDKSLKTKIKSGNRNMKDFLSKLPIKTSAFNLMSNL